MSPRFSKNLRYALPFAAYIATGVAYLAYTTQIRLDFKRKKALSDQYHYLATEYKIAEAPSAEEVYKNEIEGRTFDNWTNIRGPHPGEDNSAYEELLEKQRENSRLKHSKEREHRRELYQKRLAELAERDAKSKAK